MVKGTNVIGAWAFLIGVIIALVVGLVGYVSNQTWMIVLMAFGIIIGLLNVAGQELKDFMIAGTVLVIVSALGGPAFLTLEIAQVKVGAVFQALTIMFVPATIVVSLKSLFALAKN
jgi:hypothetical protein